MITVTTVFAGIGMATCIVGVVYFFTSILCDIDCLKRDYKFLNAQDDKRIEWLGKLEKRIFSLEEHYKNKW